MEVYYNADGRKLSKQLKGSRPAHPGSVGNVQTTKFRSYILRSRLRTSTSMSKPLSHNAAVERFAHASACSPRHHHSSQRASTNRSNTKPSRPSEHTLPYAMSILHHALEKCTSNRYMAGFLRVHTYTPSSALPSESNTFRCDNRSALLQLSDHEPDTWLPSTTTFRHRIPYRRTSSSSASTFCTKEQLETEHSKQNSFGKNQLLLPESEDGTAVARTLHKTVLKYTPASVWPFHFCQDHRSSDRSTRVRCTEANKKVHFNRRAVVAQDATETSSPLAFKNTEISPQIENRPFVRVSDQRANHLSTQVTRLETHDLGREQDGYLLTISSMSAKLDAFTFSPPIATKGTESETSVKLAGKERLREHCLKTAVRRRLMDIYEDENSNETLNPAHATMMNPIHAAVTYGMQNSRGVRWRGATTSSSRQTRQTQIELAVIQKRRTELHMLDEALQRREAHLRRMVLSSPDDSCISLPLMSVANSEQRAPVA